jgi:hypothetical protein
MQDATFIFYDIRKTCFTLKIYSLKYILIVIINKYILNSNPIKNL